MRADKIKKNNSNSTIINWNVLGLKAITVFTPMLLILAYLLIFIFTDKAIPLMILHILTLLWVLLVVKKRWIKIYTTTLAIFLSCLPPLLYDILVIYGKIANVEQSPYANTFVIVMLYTLPWAIVTMLINILNYRRHKRESKK